MDNRTPEQADAGGRQFNGFNAHASLNWPFARFSDSLRTDRTPDTACWFNPFNDLQLARSMQSTQQDHH
jgi:hypothetical protein